MALLRSAAGRLPSRQFFRYGVGATVGMERTSIADLTLAGEASSLSTPHGGRLVGRRLEPEEAVELVQGAPSLTLSPAEAADLRALATGAYSPLTGFMSSAEQEACTQTMRLPDGLLWPIPVCLGVAEAAGLRGDRLPPRDPHRSPPRG